MERPSTKHLPRSQAQHAIRSHGLVPHLLPYHDLHTHYYEIMRLASPDQTKWLTNPPRSIASFVLTSAFIFPRTTHYAIRIEPLYRNLYDGSSPVLADPRAPNAATQGLWEFARGPPPMLFFFCRPNASAESLRRKEH